MDTHHDAWQDGTPRRRDLRRDRRGDLATTPLYLQAARGILFALREALGVLWPTECAGCDTPGPAVCDACRAELHGPLVRERLGAVSAGVALGCPALGREALGTDARGTEALGTESAGTEALGTKSAGTESPGTVTLVAAAAYDGRVRSIIRRAKEFGGRAECHALASGLRRAVDEVCSPSRAAHVVVRVPSSAEGYRRRGFDPLALVCRSAGMRVPALQRVRGSGSQKARSAHERRAAARGTLAVPRALAERVRGASVIVVDDVVTTGATVLEAVRAVRAAGARDVTVVAVARAARIH